MPKVSEEKVQVMKLSEKLMLFSLYLKDLKPKYLLLDIEFFQQGCIFCWKFVEIFVLKV